MTEDFNIDLDVMNLLKEMPSGDIAFYMHSGDTAFYYYEGTIEDMSDTLTALMEQDEAIEKVVLLSASKFLE
jgi:hypothetical protein